MLTIRVIEPSGIEEVREVKSTMLRPAIESPTGSPCLTYFMNSGEGNNWPNSIDVYDGTVYIMNENGNTIASYFLGNLPRTPATIEEMSLEKATLKSGTTIKLSGLPFELESDTIVIGMKSNFELAKETNSNSVKIVN